jgi:hypothetical protein
MALTSQLKVPDSFSGPKLPTFMYGTANNSYDEICALLGYYAASNGNPLQTFRDNLSVLSSMVKKSKKKA